MNIEQINDKNKDVFLQGNRSVSMEKLKDKMIGFMNIKNLHFLLGAGVSSGAIPTMKEMNQEISKEIKKSDTLSKQTKEYYEEVEDKENLEKTLGLLYSHRFYLKEKKHGDNDNGLIKVDELISFIEKVLYVKINIDLESTQSQEVIALYRKFYQKISLRNKNLSRVNIFTTNNDLLNERSLDDLNINYNNGFGGGLKKVFNPARFSFTYSQKIDSNMDKFEPLENMLYLFKLHGSINWVEKEERNSFFFDDIQEIAVLGNKSKDNFKHVLIYPTPLKQNQSLGAPYSDLIRHFQINLLKPNSVLFVVGYSFSDEHINNIIYQSLASNSSLAIIILGKHSTCPLSQIEDYRIYQLYTEEAEKNGKHCPIHYFKRFIEDVLPDVVEYEKEDILKKFIGAFKPSDNK